MAKSIRSYFLKATEINIPRSARATNEDNINDLTNDLNTSTDNVNTEDNVDCGQIHQSLLTFQIHNTARKLILNFQKES